jgi:hypothetical protein
MNPAERQARIDLAACYRLVAHFGMADLVYTHITLRVPGSGKPRLCKVRRHES